MALQIKRGTNLQRLELLLAAGEPFYVTDNVSLGVAPMWIGDGTTFGGVASMSPVTINELNDVEIITPVNNNVLQYDSSVGQWKNSANLTTQNLTANGFSILNGHTTAGAGITSRSISTTPASVTYPITIANDYAATYNYSGIATTSGQTILTFNPPWTATAQALGLTPQSLMAIKLSYVGSPGAMTGIAINTLYYMYNVSRDSGTGVCTARLAATYENAVNSIPLGTTGSCSAGVGTLYGPENMAVGISREVTLFNTPVTLMNDYVISKPGNNVATPIAEYNINLVAPGNTSPQNVLKLDGYGNLDIAQSIAVPIVNSGQNWIYGTTESTTTTTGALRVSGGVGIAGNLNVGGLATVDGLSIVGDVAITSTTASTGNDTGALTVDGGVGINGRLNVGGDAHFSAVTRFFSTDDSSSVDSGAVTIDGGLGVNKNVFIGGYFRVINQAVIDSDLTVGGNLIVNGTTTTVNSTTLTVDDKNIELGSVTNPTDITANGGGITLKNAVSGDKTIAWYSASNNWEFSNGITAPEGILGNISIAQSSNNNTITTSSGDLILDSFTNDIRVNGNLTVTGNLTATGTFTNDGVIANNIMIGVTSDNIISTVTGELTFASTAGVVVTEDTPISFLGAAQFGPTNNTTHGMYFYSRARTDLTFSENSTDVMRGVRGVVGVDDSWFVGGDSGGANVGRLILATADDGNEPIVARQYTGAISDANGSYRELVLLDASGNTSLPGDLTVTGNDIKSSTGATALILSDANVTLAGDLTINGNDIKSAGGTTAITLSSAAATIAGDLTVSGTTATFNNVDINGTLQDGVALENAFVFGWDENNNRLNRPNFQASSGNTSGVRISGPNATTSANARLSVFSSSDIDNGKFMGIRANNTSTNAFSIFTGITTAGVNSNSSDVIAFANSDATVYATVNPAGTTNSTDLSTKSYTDSAVTTAITALNLGTSNLVTSTTAANQILDIVSMAAFKTVKYIVQVTSAGAGTHVMECLVMHDNTTAYITVYGEMFSAVSLTNISVTVSGSDMHLLVHPTNAVTSYKVTKTSISA